MRSTGTGCCSVNVFVRVSKNRSSKTYSASCRRNRRFRIGQKRQIKDTHLGMSELTAGKRICGKSVRKGSKGSFRVVNTESSA